MVESFWSEIADILTAGFAWLVAMALFLLVLAALFLAAGFVLDLIGVL